MNTTLASHRGAALPAFTLVLAGTAAILAVIAIESDDVGSAPPVAATTPAITIVGSAHPLGAASVGIPCDELVYTRC